MTEKIADLALKFEALSYVWGSDALERRVDIECNGCIVSVGVNLASALTHLRHESESRLLWVDAICINQEDTRERSLQVQHMGDIYSSAKRVVVWLGEDRYDEAEQSFALIKTTNAYLIDKFLQYQGVDDIPPIPYHESIDAGPKKWDMVRRLMDSAWFNRVWVLQEIGLARSATIYYGKATMEWSHLVEFLLFVSSRADIATRIGTVNAGPIWDLFEDVWCSFGNEVTWRNELPLTRSLNKCSGNQSLLDILAVIRPHEATDQRDRIFAFLSHPVVAGTTQRETRRLFADYNKSLDEIYLEAAIYTLENAENPWTVLSSVDHKSDSPSLSGQRPSWVPRWDEGWYTYWLGYPTMWYRAGGNGSAPFNASFSESEVALNIQGTLVDTIFWCSRPFDDEELKLEHQVTGKPIQELWQKLEEQDQGTLYGQSSQDREYAFSLTTAAGRAADEGPAEDNPDLQKSVYQHYEDLLNWNEWSASVSTTKRPEIHRQVSETTLQVYARTYITNQRRALQNRRFFLTSKGYYGVGHRSLEVGDVCVVLRGANMPFILREAPAQGQTGEVSNCYRLIGESYVQGIMRGEIFDGQRDGLRLQSDVLGEERIAVI
ncbi:MAG: hypothetical protein Q9225_004989 [Loekoesia sp. 1 TL-2023]